MGLIHVLPPGVAASIAAGEVVERPSSVVKELIENSLDAGATAVQVEIAGGGLDLVRVSDNGRGMDRTDAPLALERFSTSKIRQAGDLASVRTLGFRGEALAAIAAVAQVTILTRTAAELEGTRVTARGGEITVEPAASPPGCSVAVTGLFQSTPARRKFLKSPLHEAELCQDTVLRYALAFPAVAFRLTVDGRERLVAPPAGLLERVGLALGREAAAEMLPVSWQAGELRVEGLISSPAIGRSRRDGQHFILNGRPIRSGLLAVMLERPYAGRLPPGRSPLAVIHLTLDPALVDVNVHPRKAEVRLAQERAVYQALSQAVSAALSPFPVQETLGLPGWPFPETPWAPATSGVAEGRPAYGSAGQAEALGQLQNTYVIARAFEELIVLDQHAAHEAVLTERLRAGGTPVPLSPPARVVLTSHESELVAGTLDVLADLGVEIEPFGANSVLLRTLPEALAGQDGGALIMELLPELSAGRDLAPELLRDRLAAKAACRAAVKAGDRLAPEQQQALLDELLAAWSPSTCPHGRPALFRLTVDEIERRFLRR
jgi:DNA mismatch repair protein MutL